MSKRIEARGLSIYYGKFKAVEDVTLTIEPRTVTAFIGPSGCGKSTLLRTFNRMNDLVDGCRVDGQILLDALDESTQPHTQLGRGVVDCVGDDSPVETFDRLWATELINCVCDVAHSTAIDATFREGGPRLRSLVTNGLGR